MNAHVGLTIDSEQAKFSALRHFIFLVEIVENLSLRRKSTAWAELERRFVGHSVRFRYRAMGEAAIHCINAADQSGLAFARLLQTEIGE
jgi:hypothetical protein